LVVALLLCLWNEIEELVVASLVFLPSYITSSILLCSKLFDGEDWNIGLLRFYNSIHADSVVTVGKVHILEYIMIK